MKIVEPTEGDWLHLREMTADEADRFLAQFVEATESAVELMVDRLVEIGDLDRSRVDYSPESVVPMWEAARPLLHLEEDVYGFSNDPHPMWWHPENEDTMNYRRHSLWIRNGLIHYLAECLLRSSDRLWIERERDRDVEVFNQPCIVGFGPNGRSRYHCIVTGLAGIGGAVAEELGSQYLQQYGGDVAARWRAFLAYWLDLVPPVGSDLVQPVWIENRHAAPFVLSDVMVSRPTLEEIHHESAEHGGDWHDPWYVRVPDRVARQITSDGNYAEMLGEALTRIEGVQRAEWVGHIIYFVDAPQATTERLQAATLDAIEALRSTAAP